MCGIGDDDLNKQLHQHKTEKGDRLRHFIARELNRAEDSEEEQGQRTRQFKSPEARELNLATIWQRSLLLMRVQVDFDFVTVLER